jgi:hypothetical protein
MRLVLLASLLTACAHSSPPAVDVHRDAPDAWLVVPGTAIGRISLGERVDDVIAALGPPSGRVVAPGYATALVWLEDVVSDAEVKLPFGHLRHKTSVLVRGDHVVAIAVTSPRYHTADGAIRVGRPVRDIDDALANHVTEQWVVLNTDEGMATPACKHFIDYDDAPSLGVAVASDAWGCLAPEPGPDATAIVVHRPGVAIALDPSDALPYAGRTARSLTYPAPEADAFYRHGAAQ